MLDFTVTVPYYLVFFKVDMTVAPTKASYILEKADILDVGSVCHVKDKSGVHEGIVVTYGKLRGNCMVHRVHNLYNGCIIKLINYNKRIMHCVTFVCNVAT